MRCNHIKANGGQCEANAINKGKYCFWHDPAISNDERREAQSKGGKANKIILSNPLPVIPINKTEDIIFLLTDTIQRVRSGEFDIKMANCLGILSGHLLKAFELAQIEGRVEIIEKTILERKTTIK